MKALEHKRFEQEFLSGAPETIIPESRGSPSVYKGELAIKKH
jgi:hypothetical protein